MVLPHTESHLNNHGVGLGLRSNLKDLYQLLQDMF